jgi:SSS family solute:Na+ symporter
MFITVPIGALMGPPMWLRFYSADKKKHFDLIPLLICITAIQCIGTLFAGSAGIVTAPGIQKTDQHHPGHAMGARDVVLSAVLFCGVASAALSTEIPNPCGGGCLHHDIHKRYINISASEKRLVSVGKWSVLIISALAYILLLNNPPMIIYTGTIGMSGTAQIFVPVVGARFWNRSNGRAAACGVSAGILTLTGIALSTELNISYCAVIALLVNAAVFIAGSRSLRLICKPGKRSYGIEKTMNRDL